ncbi:hypothetical protein D3C86_1966080 [compost metagenome]
MRVGKRIWIQTCRNQSGHVGHINEEVSADPVSDGAKAREIQGFRVSGKPRDDHLRLMLHRQPLDFVVIDQPRHSIYSVLH